MKKNFQGLKMLELYTGLVVGLCVSFLVLINEKISKKIKGVVLGIFGSVVIFLLVYDYLYHPFLKQKPPLTLPITPKEELIPPDSPKYNKLKDILG